jgi:queuine tRNA-ribosyltransferase
MDFQISARDPQTAARTGTLTLPRGRVQTPTFMPVGTLASVKGLTPKELEDSKTGIVLANTYHLMLRPGADEVARMGGVSRFMAWDGPMLTDSGGYQVFSLAERRTITDEGVAFASHIDGSRHMLTPERAVTLQSQLNADIQMVLDVCPPLEATREEVAEAVGQTTRWARRAFRHKARLEAEHPLEIAPDAPGRIAPAAQTLFPIVQGGAHPDLRTRSAEQLLELDAAGYAIGGVSVGEPPEVMRQTVEHTAPLLPEDRPRYLMGVGHPRDMLMGIAAGVDLFDCVLPTRNGRNGQAFTADGPINLRNARWREAPDPVEPGCDCYCCRTFTRGYLRHLVVSGEMLASRLVSLHNVRFLLRLAEAAREAIRAGTYGRWAHATAARYLGTAGDP